MRVEPTEYRVPLLNIRQSSTVYNATWNPEPFEASNPVHRKGSEDEWWVAYPSDWIYEQPNSCAMTYADVGPFAWWSADFDAAYKVSSIWILPKNSWASEHIGNAEIWIDDHNCTVTPSYLENGKWREIKCDNDYTIGKSITIRK